MESRNNLVSYLTQNLFSKYNPSSMGFSSSDNSFELSFARESCKNSPRCRQEIYLSIGNFLHQNRIHYHHLPYSSRSKLEFQSDGERFLISVSVTDLAKITLFKLKPFGIEIC